MKPFMESYTVLDLHGRQRGWIKYDTDDGEELCRERCIIVGKHHNPKKENDFLVVRPTGMADEYKRVGVGTIYGDYVVPERNNVRLV
jgi:hypothetical protein